MFLINSEYNKTQCIKQIQQIDIHQGQAVLIEHTEKLKTKEQCALFHSLLKEFVDTGCEFIDNFNPSIGWWKYQIKISCNFYNTRKGCLWNKQDSILINNELKKIDPVIRKKIINAITMNVKSISQATTKELRTLIRALFKHIITILSMDMIYTNYYLINAIETEYNNIYNQPQIDNDEKEYIKLFEDNLRFYYNSTSDRLILNFYDQINNK